MNWITLRNKPDLEAFVQILFRYDTTLLPNL